MLDFYQTIYNVKKWDTKDVIKIITNVLSNEHNINLIKEKLESLEFQIHEINISDIYKELEDHIFLILNYKNLQNSYNYILIDPNFIKFCKTTDEISPFYFEAWPSEILQNTNPNLLKNLIVDKYCYIDDKNLNDYINSFTNKKTTLNLEKLLLGKYKNNNIRRYS